MKKLTGFVDHLSLFLARIASVIFWIVVILVAVNIVGRKLFNFTIAGIIEIVQYGMLVVMTLSMARTTFTGGHVTVSIITGRLPKAVRCIIEFLGLLLSAALVAAAAYICIQYVPKTFISGQVTERYKIPFYLIYGFMTFGLIISSLTFLFNAVRSLFTSGSKEDENTTEGGMAE